MHHPPPAAASGLLELPAPPPPYGHAVPCPISLSGCQPSPVWVGRMQPMSYSRAYSLIGKLFKSFLHNSEFLIFIEIFIEFLKL
jgi:hypothetical protein